ncbi:hypothetical protein [Devosia ginsengisoli]|uniref:hypothetical protein n=1 Tax=Devosia ginsengisoli TaxID=400770 RepID=UPI0026EE832F|nr:hypothetical protein [Devosia ginsengisoli]MCR6673271.1 hypothetical protein [Devosia ginsengisoli]
MICAAAQQPGVEGAILSILKDPIVAIALARQIDREAGVSITANLQEAALAVIAARNPNKEEHHHVGTPQAA